MHPPRSRSASALWVRWRAVAPSMKLSLDDAGVPRPTPLAPLAPPRPTDCNQLRGVVLRCTRRIYMIPG